MFSKFTYTPFKGQSHRPVTARSPSPSLFSVPISTALWRRWNLFLLVPAVGGGHPLRAVCVICSASRLGRRTGGHACSNRRRQARAKEEPFLWRYLLA